jgi:hypothetical protein
MVDLLEPCLLYLVPSLFKVRCFTLTQINIRSLKWKKKHNNITDDLDFQGHCWLISMKTLGSCGLHLLQCMRKSEEVSRNSLACISFRSMNIGRCRAYIAPAVEELYGCCLETACITSFYLVEFHLKWSSYLIYILWRLWVVNFWSKILNITGRKPN